MRETLMCVPTTPTDLSSGGFWSIDADRRAWSRPSRGAPANLYKHNRFLGNDSQSLSATAYYDQPTIGSKVSVAQSVNHSERRYGAMRKAAAERTSLAKPLDYTAAPGSYSPVSAADVCMSANQYMPGTSAFRYGGPRTLQPSKYATSSEPGYSSVVADGREWVRRPNGQGKGAKWAESMRFPREPAAKLTPAPSAYQSVFRWPEKGWTGTARSVYPTSK